jgi:dolichol-phosphate mannosyltransferase
MSVAVLLPTYCEAENIESLIREIEALRLDLRITVIDDSSPDGTLNIASKLRNEYGNIHLISRHEKLGLGTAITTGFTHMLDSKEVPDYIITMDADYSHNPQDIPRLLAAAKNGCDLAIGSRYTDGGKVIGSSVMRRIISRLANLVATAMVGAKLRDCTSGFRCYSRSYVKEVLPSLHSQTYEIQIETVKQAWQNGFKIKEIPITFVNRKKGKSKLTGTEAQAFIYYTLRASLSRLSQTMNPGKSRKISRL